MARKNISDLLVCLSFYVRDQYTSRNLSVPMLLAEIAPLKKNYAEDWLMYWTDEPVKIVYAAMERAFDRGYLDYGTWLRGAWLEPAGQDLLTQELGIEFQRDELHEWYYQAKKQGDLDAI